MVENSTVWLLLTLLHRFNSISTDPIAPPRHRSNDEGDAHEQRGKSDKKEGASTLLTNLFTLPTNVAFRSSRHTP